MNEPKPKTDETLSPPPIDGEPPDGPPKPTDGDPGEPLP